MVLLDSMMQVSVISLPEVVNETIKGADIIEGVTQVVNRFGKIIVLEDDLVTSPYFLTFMNEALEKFEKKKKLDDLKIK